MISRIKHDQRAKYPQTLSFKIKRNQIKKRRKKGKKKEGEFWRSLFSFLFFIWFLLLILNESVFGSFFQMVFWYLKYYFTKIELWRSEYLWECNDALICYFRGRGSDEVTINAISINRRNRLFLPRLWKDWEKSATCLGETISLWKPECNSEIATSFSKCLSTALTRKSMTRLVSFELLDSVSEEVLEYFYFYPEFKRYSKAKTL